MNCLLAIFFFTGKETPQDHRLALMSTSPIPVNEVYTLHYNTAFPEPRKGTDVYKTHVDVSEPGTYVTVYCSRNWQSDQIRMKLWDARDKLSNYGRGDPISRSEIKTNCLSLIRSLTSEPQSFAVHSKDLIETDKCTEEALGNLALECIFKSTGVHLSDKGKFKNYRPTVIFDEPIKMSSLAGQVKFFHITYKEYVTEALVWCNGNIHLFGKVPGTDKWYLETSIIYDATNGEIITDFLLENNRQIREAWMNSTPSLGYIRNTRSSKLLEVKGRLPLFGAKVRGHKLKVDRLSSTDAEGYLNGETCSYLGDINKQAYDSLYEAV